MITEETYTPTDSRILRDEQREPTHPHNFPRSEQSFPVRHKLHHRLRNAKAWD